jgi:hypothetical protein
MGVVVAAASVAASSSSPAAPPSSSVVAGYSPGECGLAAPVPSGACRAATGCCCAATPSPSFPPPGDVRSRFSKKGKKPAVQGLYAMSCSLCPPSPSPSVSSCSGVRCVLTWSAPMLGVREGAADGVAEPLPLLVGCALGGPSSAEAVAGSSSSKPKPVRSERDGKRTRSVGDVVTLFGEVWVQ